MHAKLYDLIGKALGIFLIFAFLAGWITVFGAASELYKLKAARTWPSREAVITHSDVRHIRIPFKGKFWRAEISGKYLDNGQKFTIRRVRYGMELMTRWEVKKIVARYPVNKRVDAYYSPENAKVILEPDVSMSGTWAILMLGLVFGLLPVVLYGYGQVRGSKHDRWNEKP
jgi:hypothetical protein